MGNTDASTTDLASPGVGTTATGLRRWTGDHRLAPEARRVFEDLLAYCFPGGQQWRCRDGEPPCVEFPAGSEEQAAGIAARLDEALRRARTSPPPSAAVLLDQPGPASPAMGGGTRQEDYRVGPGLRVTGPGVAGWMRVADRLAEVLAARLGAAEYGVPTWLRGRPWSGPGTPALSRST